jgi:hypothetical protein
LAETSEPNKPGSIFAPIFAPNQASLFPFTKIVPSTGDLTHNKGVFVHEAASDSSIFQRHFIQKSLYN